MQEQFARTARTQRPRRISVFDGQDLKKALLAGAAWLEEHREAINALNVFPVPDGDTGSNMSATMQAAIRDIKDSQETSAGVMRQTWNTVSARTGAGSPLRLATMEKHVAARLTLSL